MARQVAKLGRMIVAHSCGSRADRDPKVDEQAAAVGALKVAYTLSESHASGYSAGNHRRNRGWDATLTTDARPPIGR